MVELLDVKALDTPSGNDVKSLKKELKKAKQLCDKLDTVIENAPDGIYVTDGDANAIRINPAFERISGLHREDMLGVNHRELEKNGIVSKSSALMVVKEKKPVTIIHEYLPTNRQALVTSVPVFDEDGEIEMIVSSTRDVTELYELRAKLAEERRRSKQYKREIEEIKSAMLSEEELVAADKKTTNLLYYASRVAGVDSTILIQGETGTGKEEIAKYIHKHSARAKAPFIAVNCGAIPENLVESELFGYEKGAFTGADAKGKLGILELADKGTIFLDEVGELTPDIQAKLLRTIENGTIMRVGGTKSIPVNVRYISATNRDLERMVRDKTFRKDLYYRLNVVPVMVPPLRERCDDIIPLINHFALLINRKYGLERRFSRAAYSMLQAYDWPGNVRELKNFVERAVVTSENDLIDVETLYLFEQQNTLLGNGANVPLKERLARYEYTLLEEAYLKEGSVRAAASFLQMPLSTYVRRRKQLREVLT